jgi:hypothetical protein
MVVTTLLLRFVEELGEIDGIIIGIGGVFDAFPPSREGGVGGVPPVDGGAELT